MTHPSDTCRQLLVRVLFVLVLVTLAGPVHARPQVLLVFDEDKDLPGLAVINRNIQQVLRTEFDERVEFYSESLNISQFQHPEHQTVLRDYFQRKYQDRQIDLIVAVMEPSLDFLLRHAGVLFAGVPIVFCGANPGDVTGLALPDNVSSKPQGLGMGLAISRSIVESHGGLIWATRNEGRGLTMHVDFPSRT